MEKSHPILASPNRQRLALAVLVAGLWLLWSVVVVEPAAAQAAREDKALGRPATASTVEDQRGGTCAFRVCTPDKANDGNAATRWGSAFEDNQFWQVDLGGLRLVDTVVVDWQFAYALRYRISTSTDGVNFSPSQEIRLPRNLNSVHVPQQITFAVLTARYVRITGLQRATKYGFSIWSVNVFGPPEPQGPPAASAPPPPPPPAPGPPVPTPPGTPSSPPTPATPATPPTGTAGSPGTPGTPSAPKPAAPSPALRPIAASTRVRLAGSVVGSRVRIRVLSVRAPRKAMVRVSCKGPGCPSKVRSHRGSSRFRELRRVLRAGAVVEVFVTQRGTYGKYTRFTIRRGTSPRRTDRCVLNGKRTPVSCPST